MKLYLLTIALVSLTASYVSAATTCSAGRYIPDGTSSCTGKCPAGTYGIVVAVGVTANQVNSCLPCDPASTKFVSGATGRTTCPCLKGFEPDPTTPASCKMCLPGSSSAGTDGACTPCVPGTYWVPANWVVPGSDFSQPGPDCRDCDYNVYTALEGSLTCLTCNDGTIKNRDDGATRNQVACLCQPGYEGFNAVTGKCSTCPANFIPTEDKTDCVECPRGTASVPGDIVCTPFTCLLNTYLDDSGHGCTNCPSQCLAHP